MDFEDWGVLEDTLQDFGPEGAFKQVRALKELRYWDTLDYMNADRLVDVCEAIPVTSEAFQKATDALRAEVTKYFKTNYPQDLWRPRTRNRTLPPRGSVGRKTAYPE